MILYGIFVYLLLFIAFVIFLMRTAPLGYEDSNGFHFLEHGSEVTSKAKKKVA